MEDLLVPRTDGGVAVQAVIAVTGLIVLNLWARTKAREVRLFAIGLVVMTVALFGLRALH